MSNKMTVKERLLHSALFEGFALASFIPLSVWITGHSSHLMLWVSVTMSAVAMLWNFVYNWGFDQVFGFDRLSRGLGLRVTHSLLFEIGLLTVSLPLLMVILNMSFWDALIFDIAAVVFFLIYTVLFNWAYDILRDRINRGRGVEAAGGMTF